jgi:hypothetical protein
MRNYRINQLGANNAEIIVEGEIWGKVWFDQLFKVYRHSDDRYVATFGNFDGVVRDLIECVERKFFDKEFAVFNS